MKPLQKNFALILSGILVGIGLGFLLLFVLGFGRELVLMFSGWQNKSTFALVPEIDQPAPDFNLNSLDGNSYRLSSLQGKAAVVNFWATWCGPCRQEMPLIQKYAERYPATLTVLAVNDGESIDTVQAFVSELELDFPILLDPDQHVTDAYRIRAFPTTYFVDSSGAVRVVHVGVLNEEQLSVYLWKIGVEK